MPRRFLSTSTAATLLRADRAKAPVIREERLRVTAGLRGVALSCWRGLSGKRYVVSILDPAAATVSDLTDAVLIAVARDGDGVARIVGVAAAGSTGRSIRPDGVIGRGATELHVHRLAEDVAERARIVADLTDRAPALVAA